MSYLAPYIGAAAAFQAENEGSIRFTRSSTFKHLMRLHVFIRQEHCCSFGQMSVFCSRSSALLCAGYYLLGRTLHILPEHRDGGVPALREYLTVSRLGVPGFGESDMTERCER
jgi:hypothetical protein